MSGDRARRAGQAAGGTCDERVNAGQGSLQKTRRIRGPALTTAAARTLPDGALVHVSGLPKYLQRPPTAPGVAFGAIEDETVMINLVFAPHIWDSDHRTLRDAPAVLLTGRTERSAGPINLAVRRTDAPSIATPAHRRHIGHR
ncbi:hypothetical protein [Streptomyces cyaneofuscatus]|uniref:hypothetical protein n=1 Tax=Streptomyces cyaneofuscatus TaxID=66883 RepID=UPI00331CA3B4